MAKPTVWLASYADAKCYLSAFRLCHSVRGRGIDRFRLWTPRDLPADFRRGRESILRQKRGAGYWLWKPFIILETMREAAEGDVVIYCDAGVEIGGDLSPLVEIASRKGIVLFSNRPHMQKEWTKRDAFVLLDADSPRYWDAGQLMGGFMILQNNARARDFVNKWLAAMDDERVLTDAPNRAGAPNFSEFREHRHDQSILSILAMRENIEIFRDPSQNGAPCAYSMPNSPYGTLLYVHRKKARRIKLALCSVLPARTICKYLWRRAPPSSQHQAHALLRFASKHNLRVSVEARAAERLIDNAAMKKILPRG